MKRLLFAIISFLVLSVSAKAAHIIGGEMRYTYLGPGSSPNTNSYRITLILFRDNGGGGAGFFNSYIIGIYNNDNGQKVLGTAANNNWLVFEDNPPGILPVPIVFPSCIQGAPTLDYQYQTSSLVIDLPQNANGYTATYQTCCRISGMVNVGNSTGVTYNCVIPGVNTVPSGNDSSPQFGFPVNVVCRNAPFTLNFGAADPNPGDSLTYSLCFAYNGGGAINTGWDDPAPPPYGTVIYIPPFSGTQPLGPTATINPATGVISGIAPDFGKYVVCVCINVYRNGVLIATHRKDLIVQVSDCNLTVANPMPNLTTCNGFDVQFSHTSSGANSVFWDFGDPSTLADTSLLDSPNYTYPDTGTFVVKFIINKGTSCADTAFRTIKVYPGFFPDFLAAGGCYQNPFFFTDATNTSYGVVNSWSWNFGDLSTLADTSHLQNPQWTYSTPGTKTVTLTVTNSKGCVDTKQITIDVLAKPLITLAFADTLICRNDAVQLNASGTGSFSWTPPINIINANTATPTVSPTSTQWYFVNLNDNGCINNDSVRVRVVNNVSLQAINDTTICQGDAIQLGATSDGLTFNWTPVTNLSNPNIINPIAITNTTTTYNIVASIGSCSATDQVVVTTVPYPVAAIGPDQVICYNSSAQLNASMVGISFNWSPVSYLNNPNILNPVSTPPRTTQYIFSVFDTLGCPKPGRDTIIVTVNPRVRAFAGRDTIVVVNQPLQFNGTGGVNYLWTPSFGLSNPNIYNPVGVYGSNIDSVRYKLVVTDDAGCADSAYVVVRVYQVKPTIFVPTAFTPNGDGLNDTVYPISVGIRKINYFSIYNRWGQLVFTTTEDRKGWDGRLGGKLQSSAVFVWMVSAEDYQGVPVFLKGTVALIR